MNRSNNYDGSFYALSSGNVFKNGKPYIVINSKYNGGNHGGSILIIFELLDSLKTIVNTFYTYSYEDKNLLFKDDDSDSIPELKMYILFSYGKDDNSTLTMHFQLMCLKFINGKFVLDTVKMNKSAPNELKLKQIVKNIEELSENGNVPSYNRKRELFYKMVELVYSGNLESAYKLLSIVAIKYRINEEKFKAEFEKRMQTFPFLQ